MKFLIIMMFVLSGCAYDRDLRERMGDYDERISHLEEDIDPRGRDFPEHAGDDLSNRVNMLECRLNGDCNLSGRDLEDIL